jgi:aspartate aminotransferase-like enzyme
LLSLNSQFFINTQQLAVSSLTPAVNAVAAQHVALQLKEPNNGVHQRLDECTQLENLLQEAMRATPMSSARAHLRTVGIGGSAW